MPNTENAMDAIAIGRLSKPVSNLATLGNINIVNINDELERRELEESDSLRSPRFNARLLDRLGERHCVLCNCAISEIIQGAHIWPVSDIKRMVTLTFDEKLEYATDGENGLWMCQNHHKMFDTNILFLSTAGEVSYSADLTSEDKEYIDSITTVTNLPASLITPRYIKYLGRRYSW